MMSFFHPRDLLMPSPFALLDVQHALHAAAPSLELHHDKSGYHVTLAVPGVRLQDLRLEVTSGVLKITAEQRHSRFARSIALPKDADFDQAQATYADGLLSVSVAKLAKAAPRRLAVEPADAAAMDESDSAEYQFELAAPGVRTEDLTITLDNGLLHVAGETKSERRHAAIDRKIRIPEDLDAEQVTVTHVDGLLCFALPPKATEQPRQLAIQTVAHVAEPRPHKIDSAPSAEDGEGVPPAA